MRPGSLAKRGLGYEQLKAMNPRIVFCNISGYGMTGPYQNLPAHGIAFDTWAGIINPAYDEEGFCYIQEHASMGQGDFTGPRGRSAPQQTGPAGGVVRSPEGALGHQRRISVEAARRAVDPRHLEGLFEVECRE